MKVDEDKENIEDKVHMITAIFYNCRYEVAAEEYKEAVKTLMNVDEDKENVKDKVHMITAIFYNCRYEVAAEEYKEAVKTDECG